MLGGKKYLGILEVDTIKHAEMKIKKIPQENEETSQNPTILQKSQRDKYQGCLPHKILGTILKVDERRTPTNRPENKKTIDDI